MLDKAEKTFYSELVLENSNNPKDLFRILNLILNRSVVSAFPVHDSSYNLATEFMEFFTSKIEQIYACLEESRNDCAYEEVPKFKSQLKEFRTFSEEEVRKLLMKSPSKSCEMDPIPTWLLKQCLDELLPLVTHIINLSFKTAEMPAEYKLAILLPLLKKIGLQLIKKNYRPVSNLTFMSKLIERGVGVQLTEHMKTNNLYEKYQSAYSEGKSTETALIRVQNDILMSMESQQVTALIMLDLSAAFDTVNHTILLQRLEKCVGVTGKALQWIASYLSDRKQRVRVEDNLSEPATMKCGVPQGSVLGPYLFNIYTLPVGDIICAHGLAYHIYADDKQTYISFKPENSDASISRLNACIVELREWLKNNFLKLNDEKSLLFSAPHSNVPSWDQYMLRLVIPKCMSVRRLKT